MSKECSICGADMTSLKGYIKFEMTLPTWTNLGKEFADFIKKEKPMPFVEEKICDSCSFKLQYNIILMKNSENQFLK